MEVNGRDTPYGEEERIRGEEGTEGDQRGGGERKSGIKRGEERRIETRKE